MLVRHLLRAGAAAVAPNTRAFAGAALGFATANVHQWGNPSSKMAGLEGSILGAGNPLLDISALVTPELLEKYGVSIQGLVGQSQGRMRAAIRGGGPSPPCSSSRLAAGAGQPDSRRGEAPASLQGARRGQAAGRLTRRRRRQAAAATAAARRSPCGWLQFCQLACSLVQCRLRYRQRGVVALLQPCTLQHHNHAPCTRMAAAGIQTCSCRVQASQLHRFTALCECKRHRHAVWLWL